MKEIKFDGFSYRPGRIEFRCREITGSGMKENEIYLEMDDGILPGNDAVAYAVVSMCGTAYDEITIDMPITKKAKKDIEFFTKAIVHAKTQKERLDKKVRDAVILNFSGGFDSLAAMYLLPSEVKLVAVDFGGRYKRERDFFEQFQPYILRTNFRQAINADQNSWTFMGAGALLYSEYLNASYHVFGTILEAAASQMQRMPGAAWNAGTLPFSCLGLKDIRCMNGLTEAGTAMVVSHYAPELADGSLASLSYPGTVKRYRKEMLLEIINEKYGRRVSFSRTQPPAAESRVPFGKSLAEDFLCFYFLKNKGRIIAEQMISDIPGEVLQLVKELKLRFYERLNCAFLDGSTFPSDEFRADYMKKLIAAGVLPYEENDYREYRAVVDCLDRYHHFYTNTVLEKEKDGRAEIQMTEKNTFRKFFAGKKHRI